MVRFSQIPLVACATFALAAAGCGSDPAEADRPQRFPVTGTVTYQNQPLAGAQVTFNPQAPDGKAAFGRTDDNGVYELTTFEAGDGAVAGKYTVTIQKYETPEITGTEGSEEEYVPPEATNAPPPEPPKNLAPQKYSNVRTSDLQADVSQGGDNTHDFTLTD